MTREASPVRALLNVFLSVVLVLGLMPTIPARAYAADPVDLGSVHVIVENTTSPKSVDVAWEGTLVDADVALKADSTGTSVVVDALAAKGYTQKGAESNYISEINGLAAFDGGEMSGWMCTLNDWFTDSGIGDFTVANGKLADGDEVRFMYTTNGFGEDLGGSWSNSDKTVKAVSFSAGELDNAFSKDVHAYTLTVPEGTASVKVAPTASNKNYQVRASVGGAEYKRTAAIPVSDGAVITVKCGDPAWPSMNGAAGEAQVYTFTVAVAAASYAPFITAQPADVTCEVGKAASLSVVATAPAGAALTYQWFKVNGESAVAVEGATQAIFAAPTAEVGEATYYCVVTNTVDGQTFTAQSDSAKVTVEEPAFNPLDLFYDDFRLYPTVAAYNAGVEPYTITPAFDPNREDQLHYSVLVPDYQTKFFGYRTLPGVDGYLKGTNITLNDYKISVYSSYKSPTYMNSVLAVQGNQPISSPTNFGDSYMYIHDYLQTPINGKATKFANIRIAVQHEATLKALQIDGTWEKEFDRDTKEYTVHVDPSGDGIDISATPFDGEYTVSIGGISVGNGGTAHVPFSWDENGAMSVPVVISTPEVLLNYPTFGSTYTVTLKKKADGEKPVFLVQPTGATYTLCPSDPAPSAMTVEASASGELSYQWFKATDSEGSNAVAVEGATSASCTPALTVPEDAYYFCRATHVASGKSTDSDTVLVKVYPDPTPSIAVKTVAPELTVREHNGIAFPEDVTNGFFYHVGDEATPIEVEYTSPVKDASVTTKWTIDNGTYRDYDGALSVTPRTTLTEAMFCEPRSSIATGRYYSCAAEATLNGRTYSASTDSVWVFVGAVEGDVPAPVFLTQPEGGEYDVPWYPRLNCDIGVQKTSYQRKYDWYVNTANMYEGAVPVEPYMTYADAEIQIKLDSPITRYYFCVATDTVQGISASTKSEIIEVSGRGEVPITLTNGSGTEEDPYIMASVDDLLELKRLVNEEGATFDGKFVKLAADLTLTTETWTSSIGCTKDGVHDIKSGKNLRAFRGTFDGDGHTLTFDGTGYAKALFGYAWHTTVKNLNIQGTENVIFEDHALISTVEGVNLAGDAAVIDHVTLKSGTKTVKSGLVGGTVTTNMYAAASRDFMTTITNCVVEEGCVIGANGDQDMVGGIAGRLICVIDNCECSATVKGVNYVGGIYATPDNALGAAAVINSKFHGTVIGSGRNAGGIAGGGYHHESAPNGVRVYLDNNVVDGTVIGVTNVGGILGGDEMVAQSWGATHFTNNTFVGKVEGVENVGAIIGFYDSLNMKDDVSGNLFAFDCGTDKGIGFVKYIDTNHPNPTRVPGTTYFSTEFSADRCPSVNWCSWRTGYNRTDDPLGADAEKLCKVILTQVEAPMAAEGLVYTGKTLTGVAAPAEGAGYTVEGGTAVHAGAYTATATLEPGFVWSDGTSEPKSIEWTIAKAKQTISVAKVISAVNYNGTLSRLVKPLKSVKASGNGALTFAKAAGVDGLSVVKSGADAGKVKVAAKLGVNEYQVGVKVSAAATADYEAASKVVTVTVQVKRFAPTITVTGKVVRAVNFSKTKAKTVACPITKIQCASKPMSYALSSVKDAAGKKATSKFSVDALTGAVTVKAGTAKGTYKVNLKITSAETPNYKSNWRIVSCTVKVV